MHNLYKRVFWSILIFVNVIVILGIIWGGYGRKDYSADQKKNSHLIGVSYMTMNNEFYKIMSEEIYARIEAEGDRLILRDPALSADRQITQIHDMMDLGIDVLVITPVDSRKLVGVLQEAKNQGIRIVVLDSNIEKQGLADCTITSDNYRAGQIVGEYFLKKNESAKVVIMTHEAAKSAQDRVRGFVDTVTEQESIEIVKKIECEGQLEIAMPQMQKAIAENLDFDNVFCLNDLSSVGVVAALEDADMLDGVGVYGVDASPDSKGLIKEGMMKASAAQFPSQIGEKAADVIYRLLVGESVEENILVPVELITGDNVETFGTNRWQ